MKCWLDGSILLMFMSSDKNRIITDCYKCCKFFYVELSQSFLRHVQVHPIKWLGEKVNMRFTLSAAITPEDIKAKKNKHGVTM